MKVTLRDLYNSLCIKCKNKLGTPLQVGTLYPRRAVRKKVLLKALKNCPIAHIEEQHGFKHPSTSFYNRIRTEKLNIDRGERF